MKFVTREEKRFAALLDKYQIEWEYEPHMFVFALLADGSVEAGFSPDFYLPRWDMYVEITAGSTLSLRKKMSKIRRCVDIYPYARVRLLDRQDIAMIEDDVSEEWLETVILDGFSRLPQIKRPEFSLNYQAAYEHMQIMMEHKRLGEYDTVAAMRPDLTRLGWVLIYDSEKGPTIKELIIDDALFDEISSI